MKKKMILKNICISDPLRPDPMQDIGAFGTRIDCVPIPDDLARRFEEDLAKGMLKEAIICSNGQIRFGPFCGWLQSRIIEVAPSYKEVKEYILAAGNRDPKRGRNDVERLFYNVEILEMSTAMSVFESLKESGTLKRVKARAREIRNQNING